MSDEHGKEQALAQAASIVALVSSLECDYDRLEELRDEQESLEADVREADDNHAEFAFKDAQKALKEWNEENGEELAELIEAAGDCKDADEARERIQEDALDVQVRTGWYNPGSSDCAPEEFTILLCTGGPACRILGELNEHMEPARAWIQAQDWGTPWFDCTGIIEQSTLLTYCQQFYFGE